jgi:hypothetical protein
MGQQAALRIAEHSFGKQLALAARLADFAGIEQQLAAYDGDRHSGWPLSGGNGSWGGMSNR